MKEVLIITFLILISVALGIVLGDLLALGPFHWKKRTAGDPAARGEKTAGKPERLILTRRDGRFNYVERQAGESCGGYAAAYLMRHFGIERSGRDIYARMKKVFRGYVQVREVRRQLELEGLTTEYCRGDLDVLREELDQGDPVILLVRPRQKSPDMHYLVAAGYGRRTFFLADSARGTDAKTKETLDLTSGTAEPGAAGPGKVSVGTAGKEDRWQDVPFNRVTSEEALLSIWDTGWFLMPLHRFTYIKVRKP